MYIYHALINALSTHMIYINLNMIFYTHIYRAQSYQNNLHKVLYGKTNTAGMKILWEEEGFQFGFKRWKGWAVSKVLQNWIPNVGSKAREGAKATSLVFVLLDFQHVSVRRRA